MRGRVACVAAVIGSVAALAAAGEASASPILMPTVFREYQQQQAALAQAAAAGITPPAPPCPENGLLYPPPTAWPSAAPYPFGSCGLTELPPTSMPWGGNMAYWGGHVQVHPKEYLVFWGWGEPGAFPGQTCSPESFTEGSVAATLQCDPDGAGRYMADFVSQMGGTDWAKVSTQFFQTDSSGNQDFVSNDNNVLAGIWVDDGNDASALKSTDSSNPAGPTNTYWDLAEEALRAAAHFGLSGAALTDANFIIAQPPAFSDPNALSLGYCAFHDFTDPNAPGNSYYDGLTMPDGSAAPYISYTNMPYALAINAGGTNLCGEDSVNSGAQGKLDGFSIVLGHEIEETITDPGAEYIDPTNSIHYGGWYDALDADENGDKCAWVGINPLTAQGPPEPVPGAVGTMTGNAGTVFPVQSLWSNADDEGTGYCAGAGTDSPVPAAAYGTSSTSDTPANLSPPSISATPVVGQPLSASPGSWTNTDSHTIYVYQWQRCDAGGQGCTDIDGATSSTYTPTASDAGQTLAVAVYAANDAGSSPAASSSPSAPVASTTGGGAASAGTGQGASGPGGSAAPAGPGAPTPTAGSPTSSTASVPRATWRPPRPACAAQAQLRFALRAPAGRRVTEVQVYVDGRLAHFYVGRDIRRIAFARPRWRAFTLRLVEVLSDHRQRQASWRYVGCRRHGLRPRRRR